MGFVMQLLKKVLRVENGFGMVVTKKGLEVETKRVLHFVGASDRSILGKILWGFFGVGGGVLGSQAISA